MRLYGSTDGPEAKHVNGTKNGACLQAPFWPGKIPIYERVRTTTTDPLTSVIVTVRTLLSFWNN